MGDSLSRKAFLKLVGRGSLFAAFGGVAAFLATKKRGKPGLWQIDPFKCTQCGRCATHCVLDPSAVKCKHDHTMCGYCELCFGFFKTNPVALNEGAENQMCPTGAIVRRFVEDPYHEYTIDEDLCVGCAKCVAGCNTFGNGSLYLQVDHSVCLDCNECAIAVSCPGDAFFRTDRDRPYVIKHLGPEELERWKEEADDAS